MARPPAEALAPSVGIFWCIQDGGKRLVISDLISLQNAEPYGEFLSHGSHYEHWSALGALGAAELRRRGLSLAPLWSEYEEWPRGRVVFHVPRKQFVLYADRKLHTADSICLIQCCLGLADGTYDLRTDPHYISIR